MVQKYEKSFYEGFRLALLITNLEKYKNVTDEKIEMVCDKFVEQTNALLVQKGLKQPFEIKQTFLKVGGQSYNCECGSNLFIQYEENKWKCNLCDNHFERG